MLVRRVESNLRLPLKRTSKNGARKLSSPYMFEVGVQLHVFTLSHLAHNSAIRRIVASSLPSGVGGRSICFRSSRTCVLDLRTSSFLKAFFNYHECFGLAIRKLSDLFIYLFIQFQFSEPFNYITQFLWWKDIYFHFSPWQVTIKSFLSVLLTYMR